MARELRLRYFVELASNVGQKAGVEARAVEDAQRRMEGAVGRTDAGVRRLDRTLDDMGNNTSTKRQIEYMDRLGQAADRTVRRVAAVREAIARGADRLPELAGAATGAYFGARGMVAPPVQAFSSLEQATTDLKVALLDAKGKVTRDFDKISREATDLGNKLPGTTKDFMGAAQTLAGQGTPSATIGSGGLRASSYLGALFRMDQTRSAELVAKAREAYGLKDDELMPAADLIQRGRFAFGIKPDDFLVANSYAAGAYGSLGLKGADNAKRLIALQGLGAGVGIEGSSWGTNVAMMFQRISEIDSRVNRNSPEARAVRQMLDGHGIKMSFYNDKGEFAGIDNMMKQLVQLRSLSPLEQQRVLSRMFGVEGGRPAQVLVQKGWDGYQEAIKRMDDQASLQQRIDLSMTTFASKLDALGGTIENVMARIGSQLGEQAKPLMDSTNNWLGGPVSQFFEDHPGVGTAGLLAAGAVGALAGGRGAGALVRLLTRGGAASRAAPAAAAAARAFSPYSGLGVSAAPVAQASRLAGLRNGLLRGGSALGRAAPWLAAGIGALDVATDDSLTTAGQVRGYSGVAASALGGWGGWAGGAAAGAALGSFVPVVGTAAGGVIGGLLGAYGGSWGASSLFDRLWGREQPRQDFIDITAPGLRPSDLRIGEGTLKVEVSVTDDRVNVNTSVPQPLSLLRIDAGSTQPGGAF